MRGMSASVFLRQTQRWLHTLSGRATSYCPQLLNVAVIALDFGPLINPIASSESVMRVMQENRYIDAKTSFVIWSLKEYALNLSISLSAGIEITMIASVTANEATRIQDENCCPLTLRIVIYRAVADWSLEAQVS